MLADHLVGRLDIQMVETWVSEMVDCLVGSLVVVMVVRLDLRWVVPSADALVELLVVL